MAAQVRPASLPTIGIQDCLVLIAFLSLVLVQMQNFAQDPGVGWHLSTGQHVFSTGEIPRVDSFLASSSPRPWVADQWLGSTFLYALFKSGSWPMVYASLTLIYLLTYAAILYGVLARLSGSYIAASLAAIYAFKIGQLHFIMRPVMLSFPLFAAVTGFVYVLYHALKSASGAQAATSFRYAAVGLPLIFALWSNVHPSFVLGLGLLGLLPLSVLLDQVILGHKQNGGAHLKLWLLLGVCVLATLLNPFGYKLHESVIWLSQSQFVMTFYMEWQSPDFKGFEGELFQFPFLIIALTLLVGRPNLLGWRFFEVLTLLIFTHLGLGAVRMLPFFGIVVALPLAQCLVNLGHARILETSQMWRRVRKAFSNLEIRERRSTKGYVLLAVLSLVLLWEAGFSGRVPLFRGVYGPQPTSYPFEALTVLKREAAAADAPLVVINHMDWGSFISFFGGGKVKAVIDDRTTMLGEEFYYEYFDRMRPASDWRGYIEKLGGTHVLIRSSSQLAREIKSQEGFKILHEDELSTLFKVPRERE